LEIELSPEWQGRKEGDKVRRVVSATVLQFLSICSGRSPWAKVPFASSTQSTQRSYVVAAFIGQFVTLRVAARHIVNANKYALPGSAKDPGARSRS